MPVFAFILVVATTALPGCAGSSTQYLQNRGADLADIAQFHLIASVGVNAKVEVTRFLALGAGVHKGYAAGLANRKLGTWRETVVDLGLPMAMNVHVERVADSPTPLVSGSYTFILMDDPWPAYEYDSALPSDWLTLRVTAVVLVGIDCELRLNQLFDFAAGVFGSDPLSDDAVEESSWAV
jgi:hypothetical protein